MCLYIQFSLFTKQFLHGCYVESYDLYMVRDIFWGPDLKKLLARRGVRGRMIAAEKEVAIVL